MHARLSTYTGTPEQVEEGVRNFETTTDNLRSLDGFEGGYLLVDRRTGKAVTISLWSSAEAAEASAERAAQIRQESAGGAGMSIDTVDTYEVALDIRPGG